MKSLYEVSLLVYTDDDGLSKIEIKNIKELILKTKEEIEDEENEESED